MDAIDPWCVIAARAGAAPIGPRPGREPSRSAYLPGLTAELMTPVRCLPGPNPWPRRRFPRTTFSQRQGGARSSPQPPAPGWINPSCSSSTSGRWRKSGTMGNGR